jgi:hypothetical protein
MITIPGDQRKTKISAFGEGVVPWGALRIKEPAKSPGICWLCKVVWTTHFRAACQLVSEHTTVRVQFQIRVVEISDPPCLYELFVRPPPVGPPGHLRCAVLTSKFRCCCSCHASVLEYTIAPPDVGRGGGSYSYRELLFLAAICSTDLSVEQFCSF